MDYPIAQTDRRTTNADSSRRIMKRTEKLLAEFRRAKNARLQSGKSNPEIVFLEKAIREFETDLQTLQKSLSLK